MTAALAISLDYPQPALQRRAAEHHQHHSARRLHQIAPSQRPNNGAETAEMFSPISRKFSGEPDGAFKERLAAALTRRLHPNTGLHSEQLAGAIGAHGDTLRGWMRGNNAASGPMVSELLRFFYATGDHSFAVELFGDAITPLASHAKAQALKALDEARAALIGGAA